MNLRWLDALQAVMTLGTVTQAAEHMRLTQPAVSRMIAKLEAELGFKLFVRAHGRIAPTVEGERFHREIDRVLSGLGDIAAIARDIRESRGARVRVVAMSGVASGLLPTVFARLRNEHPDLRLSLDIRGRRDVQHWMAGQQFDIGIAVLPIEHTGLASEAFAEAELFAVLPIGHPLTRHARLDLTDLSTERFVALPSTALLRREIDRVMFDLGRPLDAMIETSSLNSACRLVAQGLGVTVADSFTVAAFPSGQFAFRPLIVPIRRIYGLLYPTSRPTSELTIRLARTIKVVATELVAEIRGAA